MKNQIRKGIAVVAMAALGMGMLAGCGGNSAQQGGSDAAGDGKVYKVGVCQLVQHGALDQANEGLIAGLKDSGYEEGVNLEIDQQNANGDQSNLQTIAQQFLSNECDIILSIATPSTQVMAAATQDIPIVGTAITSFESAGLVESDEHPGTNVTGTHDMTPVAEQIDLLLQVCPDAKVVGTVYTSSERNSEIQIGILKEVCAEKGLTVEERTITSVNDIQQATQSLVGVADAIWLPTDNNVASAIPQVVAVTEPAGLVIVSGEESQVTAGGTLTYGINFYQIGYDAGVMAAKILNGESVPADMPIQGPSSLNLVINTDACAAIGLEIPQELLDQATLVTNN